MLNIDRRYLLHFDWISFFITLILAGVGLAFVFSSTTHAHLPYSIYFKKQLFGVATGFVLYFIFCLTNYRATCRAGYFLYFAVLGLLVFTLIKGKIGMGAQRWIDLKLFRFQPSEVAKLFFPAFLTYYLYTENDVPVYRMDSFYPILGILTISSVLILKQPDLGTAIVFFLGGLIMLWLAGIGPRFFKWGLLCALLCAPLGWKVLKPYQKQRIAVFLGAGENHKERYQIEQSKIAIGSGGWFGKGFSKGTQNNFLFLPESRTDFIFSVICEEWGFLGALLILLLYGTLFFRIIFQIQTVKTFFAQLLAIGLLLPIMLSAFINVSMISGLLPIVGIPLPLLSYGVTALWITLASLGWIQGITMRKF
jgi:rod shape determining protein RodA